MPTTNYGFPGTVGALDWADGASLFGGRYCVDARTSWQATAVAGARRVTMSPGLGYGKGVWTRTTDTLSVDVPTPVAGGWYFIVARRSWGTTAFKFLVLGSTVTTTATGRTARPDLSTVPDLKSTAGAEDDIPLYAVWASNVNTSLVLVDLRNLPEQVPTQGTSAQRDAYYGVPTELSAQLELQGKTWINTATLWIETYIAGRDASYNNNGSSAIPAGSGGWQPTGGKMPFYQGSSVTATAAGTGAWTTKTNMNADTPAAAHGSFGRTSTTINPPFPGNYEIAGELVFTGNANGPTRGMRIVINGSDVVGETISRSPVSGSDLKIAFATTAIGVRTTIAIQALQDSGANLNFVISRLVVRWLGPS